MSEHRVASHLGVDAHEYDAAIRRFVPGYEAMIATMLSILDETLGDDPLVIDLGAGTGALAGAILDAIPRARLLLVDIDPTMLAVAGARIARHRARGSGGAEGEDTRAQVDRARGSGGAEGEDTRAQVDRARGSGGAEGEDTRAQVDRARAELRTASFFDEAALPPCDAVVASLSLHHVPVLDAKGALYARIYRALRPGGILLSADATVHDDGPERARVFREWEVGMVAAGIARSEAQALFAQWAGEDRYYPLAVELQLLAAAGFARPECFWKQGASTVFGGFR